MSDKFIFKLPDSFVAEYRDKPVPFGYKDAAGTSVGEIVYARTYSRRNEDGTKEQWVDTVRRVTEFTFSVQKKHCQTNKLPWNGQKALASAKRFFNALYNLKFTPPGRGLFSATEQNFLRQNSASLNNCTFVSSLEMTKNDPAKPFKYVADMSMLGVGCGFDTRGSELDLKVHTPTEDGDTFVIPDSREGWVESIGMLVNAYLVEGKSVPSFDYSEIRPAGAPLKTFGGVSAGSAPLEKLHADLTKIFNERAGDTVDSRLITDIMNLIGVCVVSGNVRRSALVALGSAEDDEFIHLKDYERYPERVEFGWMSNNSVIVNVGDDLSSIAEGIRLNGEPGVMWLDQARKFGRLSDEPNNRDYRVSGGNPCMEIMLESYELCNLSEVYLNNMSSKEEFLETLKSAYLYAKTVALMPTHVEETNSVMLRNRRIGLGLTGIANFVDSHGLPMLREWMEEGYQEVQRLDRLYSEWLCVRESIKTTTVKPSGSISILGGASPGVHWQSGSTYFIRRIVFAKDDPMVEQFKKSGYTVEESAYTPETSVVVEFPIKSEAKRSEREVSIFEKVHLAAELQSKWADNSVSVTISFDPETEGEDIEKILRMYEGKLKTVSFLPMGNTTYPQMPYESSTEEYFEEMRAVLDPVNMAPIYGLEAEDSIGEAYCNTTSCEVPVDVPEKPNEPLEEEVV